MRVLKSLAGSLALIATLALAQTGSATATAAAPSAAKSKVVCRDVVPTGTIMRPSTICMTKAAWNKSARDRDADDDYSRESMTLDFPSDSDALQTGTAQWDKLPPLNAKGRVPYLQLVLGVREAFRTNACALPGQTAKSFDITVRYAVQLDPNGTARRVVVEDSGCATVNALVGLTTMARSKRGDFAPTGAAKARWYADSINFTLQ